MTTAFDTRPMTDKQFSFLSSLLSDRQWADHQFAERIAQIHAAVLAAGSADAVNDYLVEAEELYRGGASKLISLLLELPKTGQPADTKTTMAGWPTEAEVPAGRYAIQTQPGATNSLAFYKVDRPTEGRWAGYVFVKLVISDDEQRISCETAQSILRRIAEVGAAEASARYGHEIGSCGVCGRTLTNDASREAGIGPKCAAKLGW